LGRSESVDLADPGVGVFDAPSCGLPVEGADACGPLDDADVAAVGGLGVDEHPAAHTAEAIVAAMPVTRRPPTTASPNAA
jgi:hypothetical protein